jgi:hypothetical protein
MKSTPSHTHEATIASGTTEPPEFEHQLRQFRSKSEPILS